MSAARKAAKGKITASGKLDFEEEDEEDSELSEEDTSWISWFCSLKGHEFFCEVEEDYIQDDFNLTGLSSVVPYYDYALDMILDLESSLDVLSEEQQEMVETAAEMLYGLIHSRYILSNRGLAAMVNKYQNADFGRCPRAFCQGQACLPAGQSDVPRTSTVKVYCPKCMDLYYPKGSRYNNIDGAYFGTTFPHLVFQQYPDLIPPKPTSHYVPRIFGFKIHKSSWDVLKAEAAKRRSAKS